MGEATVRTFKPREGGAPLALDKVELHRAFETDKAGLTSIHVWITAEATPVDDAFQSITADVAFVLFHDGEELGTCASGALTFGERETVTVKADSGLRIDLNADVTGLKATVDVVATRHATAEQRFDPD